jgi:adenylosuccinate lyase
MSSGYQSPLESRYASKAMQAIWSADRKFSTWRRLWLALAESQQKLGLKITDAQLDELRQHLDDIDYESAARHESRLRHDVMAHIHALGEVAPAARPIIHLGATSQFVNCNTELLQMRDGLQLLAGKIARVIHALGVFAIEFRDIPTLGFTHYQPAQPTTVGKRATLWAYDLVLALEDIEHRLDTLRFRGAKGATGTQASFLNLFDGDERKVEQLDAMVTEKMDWPPSMRFAVTGQTYPRLVDAQILNALAVTAAAVHKCCNDIRLLANRKELEEPFEKEQIGSSAMAYKRNPMRCERATGMARFVMTLAQNPLNTAAAQWFERTLDDSANRRLALPEAFLALDGVLDIMHNVCSGLVVYEKTIRRNLMAELPFMASENIMMAAVALGADRQEAHEVIRTHSQAAADRVKSEGASENDLLDRLKGEAMFANVDLDEVMDPAAYVGRAPEQVDSFIADVVDPIRNRYREVLSEQTALRV